MARMNSGVLVLGDNDGCPTWEDISIGLNRQPRFGGQCREEWVVLHHTLLCHLILLHILSNASGETQLHVLLHDAHESFLGDVPTTWKTKDRKGLEEILDHRIWKQAGLYMPTEHQKQIIQHVDRLAYQGEARVVGPKMMKLEDLGPGADGMWVDQKVKLLVREPPGEALRARFLSLVHGLLLELPPKPYPGGG